MSSEQSPHPPGSAVKVGQVRNEQAQLLMLRYDLQRQIEPLSQKLADVDARLRDVTSLLEGVVLGERAAHETLETKE